MHSNCNLSANTPIQGLGKATRRGIKKCPKCGTYNGTRKSFCKNKQCLVALKPKDNLFDFDAVKLVTGTVRQVYSVRVKDTISEFRGFVQLPLNMHSDVALCFVDSCQRSFDNSILMCHEEGREKGADAEMCCHINLALKSQAMAKPIAFSSEILSKLKIPYEIKNTLQLLASDTDSPLVQRVSNDVMAVKCQVTPKQPLGYLHFTFIKGRSKTYETYSCNCTEFLASGMCDKRAKHKCIHYYACFVALSSDRHCSEEFSCFLNNGVNSKNRLLRSLSPKIKQAISAEIRNKKITTILTNHVIKRPNVLNKKDNGNHLNKLLIHRCKKIVPKIYPIEIKLLNEPPSVKNNNSAVNWSFLDWLGFVTECLNRTMQFINCGIVNSQVFYIPENFYMAFKERIPVTYNEQKTEIGSVFFSIMNVNHVKEIFDTQRVKLRIAKKFIHNDLNGYVEYDENNENEANNTQYHPSFIFFLNVGPSTVDESDNCNNPFVIEWLRNVCPLTQIGQLKIQYKYGKKSI
ncbi:hypothetical protein ABEB36_010325 [Hypothenemus hampei]|uniref:SWIM-type domain-containing protein n=1 Tax=Hypothenemus hampei TaxID=57062 RepID=A0ABD1EJ96_HYPHA